MAAAARFAPRADIQHQIRAVDAGHFLVTVQLARPDHGHPVRRAEERVVQDFFEAGIILRLHHSVHAGHADVTLAPFAHGGGNGVQRRPQIEDADADTEDVYAVRHLRFTVYDLRFQNCLLYTSDAADDLL